MADKTPRLTPGEYRHLLKYGFVPGKPDVAKNSSPKYGNSKVEWGGMTFDSKWEWERYLQLLAREEAGEITMLARQYRIVLQPAFDYQGEHIRALIYIADFHYTEVHGDVMQEVIEDAKGFATDKFKLKWKMLQWMHRSSGVKLLLTYKSGQEGYHGTTARSPRKRKSPVRTY